MGLRTSLPVIDIRIGLASGHAIVGNIGSDVSRSYTVMGDTVNLGSRLEGVNEGLWDTDPDVPEYLPALRRRWRRPGRPMSEV